MLFSPDSVPGLGQKRFPLTFVAHVSNVLRMGWPGLTFGGLPALLCWKPVLGAVWDGFTITLFWSNTSSHRQWRLGLYYGHIEVASSLCQMGSGCLVTTIIP